MKKLMILFFIFIAGCAEVQPVKFTGPNMKVSYAVSCSILSECYRKLGDMCESGYQIINVNTSNAQFIKDRDVIVSYHYAVAIECK